MSRKLIFLNGPPGVGKTTAAHALKQLRGFDIYNFEFSRPLEELVIEIYNLPIGFDVARYKDTSFAMLLGRTFRQAQIHLSEQYMKPLFGQEVWAERVLNKITNCPFVEPKTACVVAGLGFDYELNPFIRENHEILIIQITRPGHSFVNDSRSYVSKKGIASITVDNDRGEVAFIQDIIGAAMPFLLKK